MHTCETCGKEWSENYCPECGHTIGAKKPAVLPPIISSAAPVPPRPGAPALIASRKSSRTLWIVGAATAIALLLAGAALALQLKRSLAFPPGFRNAPTSGWGVRIGENEFDAADAQIDSFQGSSAFGNSAAAIALAGNLSKTLKAAREAAFTSGPQVELLDQTKGEFITYCELHSQECAFIVHVPHLRKFEKSVFKDVDARKALAQMAWLAAQKVLTQQGVGKPKLELAVGLRGISQYGPITIGYYETNATTPQDGVVKYLDSGAETHFLWTFFAPEDQVRPQR